MKVQKDSTVTRTVIFAILIRLLLMPFFYHPDIKSQHFHFQFLSKKIFNIYQYTQNNRDHLPNKDSFNYLPLTYFTLGTSNAITQKIAGPQFISWLNDWGSGREIHKDLSLFLFLLKIPYLFFDLAIAFLLQKIYKNKKIFQLWLFNPVSLYSIYILANFDIIPTFFTILSFYHLHKKQSARSFFFLGIAIAIKAYPLIFLPFFLFYQKDKIGQIIKNTLIAVLPLLLTIIPFLSHPSFQQSFLGSGLTQKIFEYKLFKLPLFPLTYSFVWLNFISQKNKKIALSFFYVNCLFLTLVNFHPQWLIWFLPFVVISWHQYSYLRLSIIFVFILAFFYILLIDDNYLFWGHLIPIDPYFVQLTSPYDFFKSHTTVSILKFQALIHKSIILSFLPLFLKHEKQN